MKYRWLIAINDSENVIEFQYLLGKRLKEQEIAKFKCKNSIDKIIAAR